VFPLPAGIRSIIKSKSNIFIASNFWSKNFQIS
jgi:hypothetical protein